MQDIFGGDMDGKQSSSRSLAVLNRVKELESMGYQFEGADASVHLLILYSTQGYCPPFQVLDYSAQSHLLFSFFSLTCLILMLAALEVIICIFCAKKGEETICGISHLPFFGIWY